MVFLAVLILTSRSPAFLALRTCYVFCTSYNPLSVHPPRVA